MKHAAETPRRAVPCAARGALVLAVVPAGPARAEPAAVTPGGAPVTLRITWGGGKPAARTGRIELVEPDGAALVPVWRLLSDDRRAPATMHEAGRAVEIHEPSGLDMNGLELRVAEWRRARLRVRLGRRDTNEEPVTFEGGVAELLAGSVQRSLDRDGNRLSIGRAPGDELRVGLAAGESALRRPGETLGLEVWPLVSAQVAQAAAYEVAVRVRRSGTATESHVQAVPVEEDPAGTAPGMREFRPLRLAVPLPADEGGVDVELEFVERGRLRWSRPVATRTIQVVVAAAERPPERAARPEWRVVHELDPGSPKLLERLRRLPGMSLPTLPTAGMTLPKLPRPAFTLPKVPLPNVPLPNMPVPRLPNMGTIVPRMTGLLAVGYSTVESHDLGPMLRLPPAGVGPAWEAIALPAGEPGAPQLVEIEYPLDQEMALGLVVLEEADGAVHTTATSGIDLRRPLIDDGERRGRLGTRRFVFWPRTRAPLLVIVNLAGRSPAMFGTIRVLAGPTSVAPREPVPVPSRPTYLHLAEPDFTRFGGGGRGTPVGGRAGADWDAFLGGIRRSADWAVAQGASGALVAVYADGGAVWPTSWTHYAPRWDAGGSFAGGLDPQPKDVLGLLCRLYARERLRLVPAVVCDGPVPTLDALAMSDDEQAAGVVTVGRDGGKILTADGRTPHYNILDPRVQAVVEGLVAELAGRLRGEAAIDGVAMLLPHAGWLHLPGVAAGLDDATFARFAAAAGPDAEPLVRPVLGRGDAQRFAARAALVEGPLRDRWLAWREAALAAFHARLADILAAARPTWNLYVMPTTLFVAGRFAERFRPHLAPEPRDAEVLREAGLDPGLITAHERIVYVAPHVHGAGDDVGERGVIQQANRSLPLMGAAAAAARCGVLLLEQPQSVDVREAATHASFTAKPATAASGVAPAAGVEARRALAEALIATDAEAVFDAGLIHACVDEDDDRNRRAWGSLPAVPLEIAGQAPAPLVVRMREGEAGLWVSLVNACGTPCQALVTASGPPTAVADVVAKAALPVGPGGEVAVPLGPWETRTIVLEGSERIGATRVVHAVDVATAAAAVLADLQSRREALEMPTPRAVLDNPSFELPELDGLVPGWELVEPGRGTLRLVSGKPSAGGNGLAFASEYGLATLRSNPFAAPATGRISIAMWVRDGGGDAQPPLRIAIEGVQDTRELYRFAPVGRGPGAMPLSPTWSQFVLQVDDLPSRGLESLRVRLDLLGPGRVEIDDVRVFDLAFDEAQRVRLSRLLSSAAERAAAGDIGRCLVELDGPWPGFLRAHVALPTTAVDDGAGRRHPPPAGGSPPARSGVVDRVRRWWQ